MFTRNDKTVSIRFIDKNPIAQSGLILNQVVIYVPRLGKADGVYGGGRAEELTLKVEEPRLCV